MWLYFSTMIIAKNQLWEIYSRWSREVENVMKTEEKVLMWHSLDIKHHYALTPLSLLMIIWPKNKYWEKRSAQEMEEKIIMWRQASWICRSPTPGGEIKQLPKLPPEIGPLNRCSSQVTQITTKTEGSPNQRHGLLCVKVGTGVNCITASKPPEFQRHIKKQS